ncbi:poly(rC)-binding protein 3 isoform X2 [Condylostylus longicornis]|uniref:poly(rC)-binding protein 3 isoform X2 n=1 Tax=Condylostylus longicornis TaxID=2530218 RepID=UPI00244DB666|nr:poly(rC)-binding protein 3 isoform X2 [Condylostylus longicornis]
MEENKSSSSAKDDSSVTLTIRLIMQGKEVGSIIGKKGEIVNRFREESGAKINISDGSCPERIVTVTGTTGAIYSAFSLITKKFEEWCSQFNDSGASGGKTQIPIRLIVPASQCGSLIGKGGSKIKEIRSTTGCSIQVASEMLPNSTERAVTLNGTAEQITQCIYQICLVMLESPPKGATIPYRPKPQVNGPVILANGQAYTIQGNFGVPGPETCSVFPLALAGGLHAGMSCLGDPLLRGVHLSGALPQHHLQHVTDVSKNPLASLAALGLAQMAPANTGGLNPAALAALAGSQLRTNNTNRNQQQHEMTVPNDLIGCIIGKGGTKIAEIRQISGAMIRISNCEERDGGNTDRTITISGNPDSVALAQYLINMSVELQKANLQEANNTSIGNQSSTSNTSQATSSTSSNSSCNNNNNSNNNNNNNNSNSNSNNNNNTTPIISNNPLASAVPLAQLLSKPGALNALSSLTALGGLTELLGGLANNLGPPIQTTGVHRNKNYTRRSDNSNNYNGGDKRNERNKFKPY